MQRWGGGVGEGRTEGGGEVRRWDKDESGAEIPSYPKVSAPESNLSAILRGLNRLPIDVSAR